MVGNSGAGSILGDRELGQALVDAIWKKSKGSGKGRTLTVAVDGQDHKIAVETYDQFGEFAYRLKFKKGRAANEKG
jgi:hypothetical protein